MKYIFKGACVCKDANEIELNNLILTRALYQDKLDNSWLSFREAFEAKIEIKRLSKRIKELE
jgi:hypothetical protein